MRSNLASTISLQGKVKLLMYMNNYLSLAFSPSCSLSLHPFALPLPSLSILLHSVLDSKNTNHSIGFVLYQNDRFFRSSAFSASSGTSRTVISANLGQESGLHVEMLFKPTVRFILESINTKWSKFSGKRVGKLFII